MSEKSKSYPLIQGKYLFAVIKSGSKIHLFDKETKGKGFLTLGSDRDIRQFLCGTIAETNKITVFRATIDKDSDALCKKCRKKLEEGSE